MVFVHYCSECGQQWFCDHPQFEDQLCVLCLEELGWVAVSDA